MNKGYVLPGIITVAVIGCLVAVNANFGAMKQNLNLERYNRLDAERKLDAAMKNSRRFEEQLNDAKRKIEGIQNIVSEGQSATSQLKSTVETTSKENEDLKASIKKLQDELTASQKAAEKAASEKAVAERAAAEKTATAPEASSPVAAKN